MEFLREKKKWWPCPLTDAVNKDGGGGGGGDDAAPAPAGGDAGSAGGDTLDSEYYHGKIKKGEADGTSRGRCRAKCAAAGLRMQYSLALSLA